MRVEKKKIFRNIQMLCAKPMSKLKFIYKACLKQNRQFAQSAIPTKVR